jgi:hypothetical protein
MNAYGTPLNDGINEFYKGFEQTSKQILAIEDAEERMNNTLFADYLTDCISTNANNALGAYIIGYAPIMWKPEPVLNHIKLFPAWEEYFSLERWLEAFEECGIDPHFYANRQRERGELMPWAMISSGVTENYLWRERERAFEAVTTPDCRTQCNGCGANHLVGGKCDV